MAKAQEVTETLLMPKATAVWLIENTALTFIQIARFTQLTEIEIEALANEDIGFGLVGRNPLDYNELTKEELTRCENDLDAEIKVKKNDLPNVNVRANGPRYTPVSKRGDKPDAIAFIVKTFPDIKDAQICKLIGTTKPTITAIRERTHRNTSTLRPRHPAELGLCSYAEFETVYHKALRAAGKDPEEIKAQKEAALAAEAQPAEADDAPAAPSAGGFDFSNFLTSGNSSEE